MVDKYKGYTHAKFYCKTKSRSKVTAEGPNLPPLVFRRPKKPSKKRVNPAFEVQIVGIRTMVPALLSFLSFLEG